ncbi:MAG: aminotransferase class I/II-fold pyridoxal phosphate-dependent enzyme [Caulobacteraceae bacterium]
MAYHPGFGAPGQRRAGAEWLAPCLGERSPDCVLVSPGAQAALAAVLGALCRRGDTVIAEPLTYPGFKGIAAQLGLRVIACASDDQGVVPEALEDVCRRERPTAVYLVPSMQNPTAVTLPAKRRREVAGVVKRAGRLAGRGRPLQSALRQPAGSGVLDPPPSAASTSARWPRPSVRVCGSPTSPAPARRTPSASPRRCGRSC